MAGDYVVQVYGFEPWDCDNTLPYRLEIVVQESQPVIEDTPTPTPSPTATEPPPGDLTLSGLVFDAEAGPGAPIVGAEVGVAVCQPRTFLTTSGKGGRYQLLLPASYLNQCAEVTLQASASGYLPFEESRTVPDLRANPQQSIGLWPQPEPTATATTWPTASLLVHKMVDKEYAEPGEVLSYTIVLMNDMLGGGDPGAEVTVHDPLPTTLAFVAGSLSAGASYDEPTRTISWEGQVPRGGSVTIHFAAELTGEAAAWRSVSNWVHVTDAFGREYEEQAQTHIQQLATGTPTLTPSPTPTGTTVPIPNLHQVFLPSVRKGSPLRSTPPQAWANWRALTAYVSRASTWWRR